MPVDRLSESFNSYDIAVKKLKNKYGIDLLNEYSGVNQVLAHITFNKFSSSVQNMMYTLTPTHYPTYEDIIEFLPTAIKRLKKLNENGGDLIRK